MAAPINIPIGEKLKGSSNFQYWYGLTCGIFHVYDLYDVAIGRKKPEHLSAEEKADWTRLIANDTWNKYTETEEPERRVNPDGSAAFACLVCDNAYHHGNYCLKNYVNRKSKAHFVNGVLVYGKPNYFESADAKAKEIEPVIAHPRCTICKKDNHGVKNCFFRPKRPSQRNELSGGVFSMFFDDYDQSFRVTVNRSYPSL
ncbi:hypothetical protein GE061_016172 [Apolygus lucorum]|uniref:Uncharacterized protein n=1 Tax=Apolygus lucorum TaxID=248454 RepID=A0A8S9XGM9_APOLU|nr:hypothetical protein GE061_016172 [Apolygus lucorum]